MASSPLRARAEANFKSAADGLQKAIPKEIHDRLGQIGFPNFNYPDNVENTAKDLEASLETFIRAQKELRLKESRRKKVKDVIVRWFSASYPFSNLLLTILKEGSAVRISVKMITFVDASFQPVRPAFGRSAGFDQGS